MEMAAVELNISVARLVFDGTPCSSRRRLLQDKSYSAFKLTVIDEQGQPSPSSTFVTDDIMKVFGWTLVDELKVKVDVSSEVFTTGRLSETQEFNVPTPQAISWQSRFLFWYFFQLRSVLPTLFVFNYLIYLFIGTG
jgi:hypothetical protein